MATKSIPFSDFQVLRTQLAETLLNLADIFESLDASLMANELRQKHRLLLDDSFRILVLGEMSRGKSTLINAILGERILPARPSRCTAIPCNVKYGEHKHALLYRRPPHPAEYLDLVLSPDALKEAVTIQLGDNTWDDPDHEDARRLHPYLEADIFAPIALCSDGVVLQDSPGLNEAPERTAETLQKLRDADAVVYVLSCMQPLSDSESTAMRTVCDQRNTRDLFFVLNFADQMWEEPEGRADSEKDTEPRIRTIAGYDATILYTSARVGLRARLDGNKQLLLQSGILQLEESLQSYLMNYRLSAKLRSPLTAAEDFISEGLVDLLFQRERFYREPVAELHRKLNRIQPSLNEAENRRYQIANTFNDRMQLIESDVSMLVHRFCADLEAGVAGRLKALDLSTWDAVANRGEAKARLARSVEVWMLKEAEEWQERVLTPLLGQHTRELRHEVGRFAVELEQNLAQIKKLLNDAPVPRHLGCEDEVSASSRLLGFGLGLLGGPGSMLEGASLGVGHAAKGLAANVLTSLVLSAALGFSAVAVGGALLGLGVIRVIVGAESYADKLRTKLAEEIRQSVRSSSPDIIRDLIAAIRNELSQERDRVDARISDQIGELTEQITSVLKERASSEIGLQAAIQSLNETRASLQRHKAILAQIRARIDQPSTPATAVADLGSELAELIASKLAHEFSTNGRSDDDAPERAGPDASVSITDSEIESKLGEGALSQLKAVVDALERYECTASKIRERIATVWCRLPPKPPQASEQIPTFRAVSAMALTLGDDEIPPPEVVTSWFKDPIKRRLLLGLYKKIAGTEHGYERVEDNERKIRHRSNFVLAYARARKSILLPDTRPDT